MKAQADPSIYEAAWPVQNPQAVVCIVHGLGEHCHRYEHVAQFFNQHKVAVLSADRTGHGRSAGKRGHAAGFDVFMKEILRLLERSKSGWPGVPVFLYGHSMGGNLVLNYLVRYADSLPNMLRGAIVTGSWIRLPSPPSAFLVAFAKMANLIVPSLTQPNKLDVNGLSKDPAVVQAYVNDPLVHDRISVRVGLEMLKAADFLNRHSGKMSIPALLMHGADDPLTDPAGTKDFADRLQSPATLKIWEGLRHEIHNEPEQKLVFEVMLEFMIKQL
jgi:alpha-beta hydrolase superfamily lysophospholipase